MIRRTWLLIFTLNTLLVFGQAPNPTPSDYLSIPAGYKPEFRREVAG